MTSNSLTGSQKRSRALRTLTESALLIAVGTVLSLFSFQGLWALGGSVTFCAMLPLVLIAWRHGTKAGLFGALVYALIQLVLGLKNVNYAPNAVTAIGIILLDYVIAFTVIGLAATPRKLIKNDLIALVVGIVMTFALRFLCHFMSGWIIWEALWPNDKGYAAPMWSLIYNGSYMLPETLISVGVAVASFLPLKRFWLGQDLI